MEIQSSSEMSPYFTMTKCNKLYILHNAYQVFLRVFKQFQPHFNVGSYDYVIQKAVTKTIRMLTV